MKPSKNKYSKFIPAIIGFLMLIVPLILTPVFSYDADDLPCYDKYGKKIIGLSCAGSKTNDTFKIFRDIFLVVGAGIMMIFPILVWRDF